MRRVDPPRRAVVLGLLGAALGAALGSGRGAAADQVLYDEYGNPVVVNTTGTTTVVVQQPRAGVVYAPATRVYGPVGIRGQSRRVARRTARRTARRWN